MSRQGFKGYREYFGREAMGTKQTKKAVLAMIAAEFCTAGLTRISLESLGIVKVGYDQAGMRRVADAVGLAVQSLEGSAEGVAHFILSLMRRYRAINDLDGLLHLDDDVWGDAQAQVPRAWTKSRGTRSRLVRTLIPAGGAENRTTWFLCQKLGLEWGKAVQALEAFWEEAAMSGNRLLTRHHAGMAIDLSSLRFFDASKNPLYRCKTCGPARS